MLAGSVGIVDGCRRLAKLFARLDVDEDDLFDWIKVVESETEDLPVGDARSLWWPEALEAKEKEFKPYLEEVRPEVLEVCEALVQRYSGKGKEGR
jgi:hypothetical protein